MPEGVEGMKRPIIAAILSGIIPGLGQFYNRHWIKGGAFLVAVTAMFGAIDPDALLEGRGLGTTLAILLLILAVAIWSVVDAYRGAKPRA